VAAVAFPIFPGGEGRRFEVWAMEGGATVPDMAEDERSPVDESDGRDQGPLDSFVVHQRPFAALAHAAISSTALALAALITATATILVMAVSSDIADARLESSHGFNNLKAIRWAAGTRLAGAVIAILLTILASFRYSRDLPATRYTFAADGGTSPSPSPARRLRVG
jgi:hypothetical protein